MVAPTPLPQRARSRGLERGPAPSAGPGHPLTVLLVHNVYQQAGGEDGVFAREGAQLEAAGHRVLRHTPHNDAVDGMGRVALAARTVWSRETYATVRRTVEAEGVDVVHVHNTLPLVSPSVFRAAHDGGAATVHTLHNYRLVCPGNLLLRDGAVCRDCVGKAFAAPAVRHRCYRDDAAATAAVAITTAVHRALGTWDREVDRFIALSEFARGVFVEGGLPAGRIAVKPNPVRGTPSLGAGGAGALFAGRLSSDKGIQVLLDAWAADPDLPTLTVAGAGEMETDVERAAAADPRIDYVGWQTADQMAERMAAADALVVPSLWYEGWPLVTVEAMGYGTPVVASGHGPFPEIVEEGVSGTLFPPGDAAALAAAVRALLAWSPDQRAARRAATRDLALGRFSEAADSARLRAIYDAAIQQHTETR